MDWVRQSIIDYFAHVYAWILHRRKGDAALAESDMQITYWNIALLPGLALLAFFGALYTVSVGSFPAPTGAFVFAAALLLGPFFAINNVYNQSQVEIRERGARIARSGAPYRALGVALSPAAVVLAGVFAIWMAT